MATSNSKTFLPEASELQEGQVTVQFTSGPDSMDRRYFFAYWLDGQKPTGVAGQAFHMHPSDFVWQEESKGRTVVGLEESDVAILQNVAVKRSYRDPTYAYRLDELA